MMAFSGVRSSWLMFARKALLVWSASSAAARASSADCRAARSTSFCASISDLATTRLFWISAKWLANIDLEVHETQKDGPKMLEPGLNRLTDHGVEKILEKDPCEVQVAYAIGVAHPVSVMVQTFGTGKLADSEIARLVEEEFDLRPAALRDYLDLHRPIFQKTAAYGHFGRDDSDFTWERTDRADASRQAAGLRPASRLAPPAYCCGGPAAGWAEARLPAAAVTETVGPGAVQAPGLVDLVHDLFRVGDAVEAEVCSRPSRRCRSRRRRPGPCAGTATGCN